MRNLEKIFLGRKGGEGGGRKERGVDINLEKKCNYDLLKMNSRKRKRGENGRREERVEDDLQEKEELVMEAEIVS